MRLLLWSSAYAMARQCEPPSVGRQDRSQSTVGPDSKGEVVSMLSRVSRCEATLKIACNGCCPGVAVLWIHRGCWGILARWSGRVRGFGGLVRCKDSERSGHQICSLWRAFAEGYGLQACVGARELVAALRRRRL